MDSVQERQWKTVGHALGRLEQPHSIITESTIKRGKAFRKTSKFVTEQTQEGVGAERNYEELKQTAVGLNN